MEPLTPKEGQWIARPKKPRWVMPAVTVVVFSTQMPTWINLLTNSGNNRVHLYILSFLVAIMMIVGLIVAINKRRASKLRPKDRELADGAFGDQYLVEVTIGSGRTNFGTDRGVLWFSEELMGFSGDATSFVLSAEDIDVPTHGQKRDTTLPFNAISLVNAPRPGYFVIHPLNRAAKGYRKSLRTFVGRRWDTEAERIWPPLKPYEEKAGLEERKRSPLGQ